MRGLSPVVLGTLMVGAGCGPAASCPAGSTCTAPAAQCANGACDLEAAGDVTLYYGEPIEDDLGIDRHEIVLLEVVQLATAPAPELAFLDPPDFSTPGGPTDAELPGASSSLESSGPASCGCQPVKCKLQTAGSWYVGWCESTCEYASALLCTQPDPWDPNNPFSCGQWSDQWALTGCPGPNPCL